MIEFSNFCKFCQVFGEDESVIFAYPLHPPRSPSHSFKHFVILVIFIIKHFQYERMVNQISVTIFFIEFAVFFFFKKKLDETSYTLLSITPHYQHLQKNCWYKKWPVCSLLKVLFESFFAIYDVEKWIVKKLMLICRIERHHFFIDNSSLSARTKKIWGRKTFVF